MTLTLQDLAEIIEVYDEDELSEIEIRFASQPQWPFEYSIDCQHVYDDEKKVVYLSEGRQIGYLPGNISGELGWR